MRKPKRAVCLVMWQMEEPLYWVGAMIGENRQLVTNDPVEFKK